MEPPHLPLAELYEALIQPAKGLAHPKRLQILELLAQGERSVDALAVASGLRVTTTSAHLQTLRNSGLVARRREGQRIIYRLAGDDVAALLVLTRRVARAHVAEVEPARRAALGLDAGPDADVEQIGRDELMTRARAGDVVVLDVRPTAEFAAAHIPGAVSIPVDELAARLDELPSDLEIVAYCRGEFCVISYDAARMLRAAGRRVRVLDESLLEWRAAGAPLVSAA